jgi:hypothetical protein
MMGFERWSIGEMLAALGLFCSVVVQIAGAYANARIFGYRLNLLERAGTEVVAAAANAKKEFELKLDDVHRDGMTGRRTIEKKIDELKGDFVDRVEKAARDHANYEAGISGLDRRVGALETRVDRIERRHP